MNELMTGGFTMQPQNCTAQVRAFLKISARYLGLAPDRMATDRQCLLEVPVTGYRAHCASNQRLENRL